MTVTKSQRGTRSRRPVVQSLAAAFTLVELLVVIGIIAVLVSILLPALGAARQQANLVKCMANLRQMGQAMAMYVQDNQGMLPFGFVSGGETIGPGPTGHVYTNADGTTSQAIDWTRLLLNEMNSKYAATYATSANVSSSYAGIAGIFTCPEAPIAGSNGLASTILCDYSCHPRILPDLGTIDYYAHKINPKGGKAYMMGYKLSHMQRPYDMALVFDGSLKLFGGQWTVSVDAFGLDNSQDASAGTYLTDQYALLAPTQNASDSLDMTPNYNQGTATASDVNADSPLNWGNIRFRHIKNTKANALLADFHVQTFVFKPSGVLTPPGSASMERLNVNVNP